LIALRSLPPMRRLTISSTPSSVAKRSGALSDQGNRERPGIFAHQQHAAIGSAVFERVECGQQRGRFGTLRGIVRGIPGHDQVLVLVTDDGHQRRLVVRLERRDQRIDGRFRRREGALLGPSDASGSASSDPAASRRSRAARMSSASCGS
jgi:hypothetical protein